MPNTIKHYVHRVGRTARAGRAGRSVSLVGEEERKMLKEIVKAAKAPVKARILPQGEQASVQQPRMAWGGAQGGQGPQSDPGGQGRGQKVMGKSFAVRSQISIPAPPLHC